MYTPNVSAIPHHGCSPHAPADYVPESPAAPRCGGSGVLHRDLTPRLDYRDPAALVEEWECHGCPDCLQDRDLVACLHCGWDDGGGLAIGDTPDGLRVHGFEGDWLCFCAQCDAELTLDDLRLVKRWERRR